MEFWILGLLIVIIVCLLLLILLMFVQNQKREETSYLWKLQNQEMKTKTEMNEKQMGQVFKTLFTQVQDLKTQQNLSMHSMEEMTSNIQNMNKVMTNTKMRGNWGEYQLDMLLSLYTGENPEIYETQYTLENGKIADAILHLPQDERVLCIDSKFPVENYLKMDEEPENREYYFRQFKSNMKKHIDDISTKYITIETTNQAILFIPSEAIYQFVCAKCDDILSYALKKHILLTSPTTLIGVIFTLLDSTKDFYRASHIEEIEKNILSLQEDVNRLVERSQKAEKSLDSLSLQFHQVTTSASKIAKRIDKMSQSKEDTL